MKKCQTCQQVKDLVEFHKNKSSKDGLQKFCKSCNKDYTLAYYHRLKDKGLRETYSERSKRRYKTFTAALNKFKSDFGCLFCDEKEAICLDFHHLKQKDRDVSSWLKAKSIDKIVDEIARCVLLCANCHRKVHANILIVPEQSQLCEKANVFREYCERTRNEETPEGVREVSGQQERR